MALGTNDRALGRVVARAEFLAKLPSGVAVDQAVNLWRGGDPIFVKRRGEGNGVGRMIDVRRAVVDIQAFAPLDNDARRRLDWDRPEDADCRVVRFQVVVSAAGSAKPVEVIEGLWGADIAADVALRVGCGPSIRISCKTRRRKWPKTLSIPWMSIGCARRCRGPPYPSVSGMRAPSLSL